MIWGNRGEIMVIERSGWSADVCVRELFREGIARTRTCALLCGVMAGRFPRSKTNVLA